MVWAATILAAERGDRRQPGRRAGRVHNPDVLGVRGAGTRAPARG